ncbi:hypothetical protein Nepgr_020235 [Nepenthes gracilis]|uniref:Glucan endo-1,3-beta-D-glucosidase n=1 Tax=Nepenthes gracilis TaxID=150966 RepID=A0AAD3SXA1_NEPGR|nr:hypothetical protein Nepgr_020235 [Nepenthes gracilis]
MNSPGVLFCIFASILAVQSGIYGIGINYGLLGDNLPPPDQVIPLLQARNIQKVRIFDPNPDVLRALEGSGIQVTVGVSNEDLQQLSSNPSAATDWVNANLIPHMPNIAISCVSAGNEVIPGPLDQFVLPAMANLDAALKAANINVPVSTAVSMAVLGSSYPPSAGIFSSSAMSGIVGFLAANNYPLMANVYPYFAYAGDTADIKLEYALFTSPGPVVMDGSLQYSNLFDAMVDSLYSALEKASGGNVQVIVSETGWPTAGNGDITSVANAQVYQQNLISHVSSSTGTPKRPGQPIETYIFALFNEDLKPAGVEQNWGLYQPDMTEVYHVDFTSN